MDKSKLGIIAFAVFAAAGLAACGSGTETYTYPAPPDPTPPAPVVDSFFAAVSAIVAASPEDASPTDPIDSIVATAPEDKEPEPLG